MVALVVLVVALVVEVVVARVVGVVVGVVAGGAVVTVAAGRLVVDDALDELAWGVLVCEALDWNALEVGDVTEELAWAVWPASLSLAPGPLAGCVVGEEPTVLPEDT